MRDLNEAWHVLRDPGRRLAHDRDLGIDHGPRWSTPPPRVDDRSVPLADQVEEQRDGPARLGDLLVLVPAALVAVAVACFAVGALMLNTNLLVLAVAALVLGGAAFVVAPFVALARDRRRARR